eukprot:UN01498
MDAMPTDPDAWSYAGQGAQRLAVPKMSALKDSHFKLTPGIRSIFVDILQETQEIIEKLNRDLSNGNLGIRDLHFYFTALLDGDVRMISDQLKLIFKKIEPTVCNRIYDSFCLQKEVRFLQDLARLASGLGKYCRSSPKMDNDF